MTRWRCIQEHISLRKPKFKSIKLSFFSFHILASSNTKWTQSGEVVVYRAKASLRSIQMQLRCLAHSLPLLQNWDDKVLFTKDLWKCPGRTSCAKIQCLNLIPRIKLSVKWNNYPRLACILYAVVCGCFTTALPLAHLSPLTAHPSCPPSYSAEQNRSIYLHVEKDAHRWFAQIKCVPRGDLERKVTSLAATSWQQLSGV